jgi:DNA-binding response OmpR family regulator
LYRGDIQVESEPGKGSTFTVTLPVAIEHFREEEIVKGPLEIEEKAFPDDPVYENEETRKVDLPESSISEDKKDKALILIVEDNEDLRNYISGVLGSTYLIMSAANGRIGLNRAQETIPDLVISDVMMPDMDGMEMCEKLRTDERTDHIPVIMLTARADRLSKFEGLEKGADDYLIKPFDNEELKIRVKNLLEQRRKLRAKFRLEYLETESESRLPSDHLFIKQLFEIFNANISDADFKMAKLSGRLNLSQSQIRRKVMALTGYTPNELFRYHRLKKAAIYFRSGHKNVAQVMYLVGFNNQSYFARCFSKLFGMTPSQFITAQKNQPTSLNA